MDEVEWIKKQKTVEEIKENNNLLRKIFAGTINESPLYFEYIVDRLFMALGNFKEIRYFMRLNENFLPEKVAPGGKADCVICYDNFDLIVETTLRPVSGTADHFNHLESSSEKKQLGLNIIPDITKVDNQLWNLYNVYCDSERKLFMLCDVDFIFKLLKDQSTSFSKYEEFLKESERIWKEESDWNVIREKIITLVRSENES